MENYKELVERVISKGFKDISINDFPLRGRKAILLIRRRVWKIEGVEKPLTKKTRLLLKQKK